MTGEWLLAFFLQRFRGRGRSKSLCPFLCPPHLKIGHNLVCIV